MTFTFISFIGIIWKTNSTNLDTFYHVDHSVIDPNRERPKIKVNWDTVKLDNFSLIEVQFKVRESAKQCIIRKVIIDWNTILVNSYTYVFGKSCYFILNFNACEARPWDVNWFYFWVIIIILPPLRLQTLWS